MSGHSKWANIKHRKAKGDAAKASIFTKIGREIAVCVKQGGPDPNNNNKLKDVIAKARENNIPNDNIMRSIKKASGEAGGVSYEEITYEGYGPFGVAFYVECLTDNKNRSAGDVRHIFDKSGGAMGTTGSVGFMFKRRGVIVADAALYDEDELMLTALDCGAEDFVSEDGVYLIYTAPQDLSTVRERLQNAKIEIISSEIDMIPENSVALNEEDSAKILKMIDRLEENDDVQNVYHNAELTETDEEEE
ncbi:MAG: YebC/PmpR family DNA-binding transcriptional regulator [Clostridiales bacterium]|jgi:YebC/PmpR family DNA-binding regulatory protein|nr:YebC/PmpR family DNA-binding transcriptional regulator [Clostridiales bacterium]